ncbi:hypothetical protein U2F26_29965 [Micromonospora sp. 4G57]|uniref:Uncharacterized protein n=1 Tax=Micromonospora sicca TaxID=2202420 RepID=A0ABU5JLS6_9ACTN|nr:MULTISPECIES: hypothetical protein [unclassified Micromonospora]MDZ5446906.1 hypothetical protein [Micromonospora sp. 4G57]MDZ5493584.1 hypothetical protein [Micromonospora sp. 4G53]
MKELFNRLNLPFDASARVRVVREEPRYTSGGKKTPADLVVRVGNVCVLFEAKVNAGEHGDQCARLARLWANEAATLVYLTRPGASHVRRGWRSLTWAQIADIMAPLAQRGSAGARDFLETLQTFHDEEGQSMPDDKSRFYLRNWEQLAEWEALRAAAVAQVVAAVTEATGTLDQIVVAGAERVWAYPLTHASKPTFELRRPHWQRDGYRVAIAVQWNPAQLLTPANPWPFVGVRVDGTYRAKSPFVKRLTAKLEEDARKLAWRKSQIERGWLWWRHVRPSGADDDLDSLTVECRTALQDGWRELSGPLDDLLAT